ncbi:hypothetical protein [Brachybacterium hainanense]|uniref:Serine protease n=1 Tax=Brachybacterium hainanense TaxID=1541174 RepID=A0ABV6RE15_9MICO
MEVIMPSTANSRSGIGFLKSAMAALSCGALVVAMLSTSTAAFAKGDAPGDSTEVSQERLATGGQEELSTQVQVILDSHPRDVVDFFWDGHHGTVLVRPEAATAVTTLAGERGFDITIEQSEARAIAYLERSDHELAILDAIGEVPGATSLAARYEAEDNSFAATVWTDQEAEVGRVIDTRLGDSSRTVALDLPLRIEFADAEDVPMEQSTTQGGEFYGSCTGGFIGKKGTGYGIITAAHCTTKPSKYDGDTTGTTYVAAGSRDIRYTSLSGGTPENKFRYGNSQYRTITSTGVVTIGFILYKYGVASGYGSSKVESYKGCVSFSGSTWCNLYYTATKITSGGDSGGPWFIAAKGFATTTGADSGGSYITPISSVSTSPAFR